MLCEPQVTYDYGQNKINKYHDKIFKDLFSNKKEAVKFINKYLKLEERENALTENEIEKCNTEFITKQKERLETDILYKVKGKKIFILIEQQSKVDRLMPIRILYYYVEIMRELEKQTGRNTDGIVPIIYPIVLYTGKTKWTASMKLEKLQQEIKGTNKVLTLTYYLVDSNRYTKEELIKERSSIAKAMLMEKIKNKEELIEVLEKVVKENLTKEEKKFIVDILANIVAEEIGSKKAKELKEKIEKKEESTMVIENLRNIFKMNYNEGVQAGIQSGMQSGIQTATQNFVIQMLKNRISEKTIKKVTQIDEKELQKIKKKLQTSSD